MSEIIKESEIERINPPELRDRCIADRSIELKLYKNYKESNKVKERICLDKTRYVHIYSIVNFLNRESEIVVVGADYCWDWFDIAAPEMRDMTPKEAFLWCKKNGHTFCEQYGEEHWIGSAVRTNYKIGNFKYMDDNGDFHNFPQTEVSE